MIYTLCWHEFSLPGASTNQFTFEKFSSKESFLSSLIFMLEENAEVICDLDGEELVSDIDKAIEQILALSEREDIEEMDLYSLSWDIGSFSLRVSLAEYFPKALIGFRKKVLGLEPGLFSEYIGLSASEKITLNKLKAWTKGTKDYY